jgi:glycosyltransferase involved in cell wall biosynthesis
MTTEPLVEVVIVTYNHKDYIAQALDSVLMQQTSFNYKIVVGDDCSTDGTINILKEYEKKFPDKIKVIYQEKNLGPYHPDRNIVVMLNNAEAKYVALLDGDDYWTDPLKLQKQVDFLEINPGFTMCFHNTLIKREYTVTDNKTEALFNHKMTKTVFEMVDVAHTWIGHTSSLVFVRKSILPLPEWFKRCFSGDLTIISLLAGNGSLKYLDFTGSVYRLNDGGVSRRYHGRFLIEGKIEMYQLIDKHFNYKYTKIISPILGKYYFYIVPINIHAFEFKKAVGNFYTAIKLKPLGIFSDLQLFNLLKIQVKKLYSSAFKPKK